MPDRPTADRTAELLFWYYRKPSRYQAEGRRRDAPPLDPEVVLKLALSRPVEFVGAAWNEPRRIPALQESAEAYVRHMFFRPDATPYQTLGLEPGASPREIKESFRLLMQLVHPDRQGGRKIWPDACAAQANKAYAALRDQDTRRTYEEEAEARAALARAINRAAMEAEASQMPVKVWTDPPPKVRRALMHAGLPEWLTAGVGGFVRNHPAATAFGVLIAVALTIVVAAMWEGGDGLLVRVAREVSAPTFIAEPSTEGSVARPAGAESTPVRRSNPDPAKPVVLASMAPGMGTAQAASDSGTAAFQETPTPVSPSPPEAPPSRPVLPAERAPEPVRAVPAVVATSTPAPAQVAKVETTPAPEPSTATSSAIGAPTAAPAPSLPPANTEVEALLATFVDSYEHGRLDAFAALFADDADTNLRRGRVAIRGEYDDLFRLSSWRRMQLTRISWRPVGDRAVAKGEITVRIGWRDGREVEQRLNVDMELARRDGRVVIARLSHQPKNP